MSIRISIALCTYNGEKHLWEQLQSIKLQERLPDELVVSDDCSTDRTIEIVEDFQRNCPFPVTLHRNKSNIGFSKNFEKAIRHCNGDIILLSDQDDYWLPDKISRFEYEFRADSSVQLVFANSRIVNEELDELGYTLWDVVKFTKEEQYQIQGEKAFRVLLRHNVVQGANMGFRSANSAILFPLPQGVIHDAWMAFLLSLTGRIKIIETSTMLYRQHDNNQLGARKLGLRNRIRQSKDNSLPASKIAICQFENVINRIQEHGHIDTGGRILPVLEQKILHLKSRLYITQRKKGWFSLMLSEGIRGNYHTLSNGMWSIIHDLLITTSDLED